MCLQIPQLRKKTSYHKSVTEYLVRLSLSSNSNFLLECYRDWGALLSSAYRSDLLFSSTLI